MLTRKQGWKMFLVSDLFTIVNGKGITKQEIFEHSGRLPAIQSGEENYGRIGFIDYDYCLSKGYAISNGACLTVARSGSSGYVGIQRNRCVAGDSAKILEPKFEANIKRLLFLRTLLMVNKHKYEYKDKVTKERYEKDYIYLPVKEDKSPKWIYMEKYIESLLVSHRIKKLQLI